MGTVLHAYDVITGLARASSTSTQSLALGVQPPQPVPVELQQLLRSSSGTSDDSASASPAASSPQATFAGRENDDRALMPPPPAKRQRRTELFQAAAPTTSSSGSGAGISWSGALSLLSEDGYRLTDLCHVTLHLPAGVPAVGLPAMPLAMGTAANSVGPTQTLQPPLVFSALAQRRGVMLGQHVAVRTSVRRANTRQLSRLRSMAQHELVAVAQLDPTTAPGQHLLLVPYLEDQAGGSSATAAGAANATMRLVCFWLLPPCGGDMAAESRAVRQDGKMALAPASAAAVAAATASHECHASGTTSEPASSSEDVELLHAWSPPSSSPSHHQ
jgi:hypothetical protein